MLHYTMVIPANRLLTRRSVLAIALSTAMAATRSAAAQQQRVPPASNWTRLVAGTLLTIEIEQRLYERAGHPHFFVRVRTSNRTDRPVGVDFGDRWHTIYPNQWGRGDDEHRTVIDEGRASVTPLDAAARTSLVARMNRADRALAIVPAHGSIDYFAEFNASGRADVEARTGRFVIVSVGGELRATDGTRVEQLAFDFGPSAAPVTEFAVPAAPLDWGSIPAGARVVVSP